MTFPSLRIARFVARTEAEGPGIRSALWVQGCTIRCRGCFNPQLWGRHGGELMTSQELFQQVPDDVEGVTLLGGEPFEQPIGLANFARLIKSRGQTVMTFTGYVLEELQRSCDPGIAALLTYTDLLVDGPFDVTSLDTRRPWVGSVNQRFHALTPRYRNLVASIASIPDRLEVRIGPDGKVAVNGWATSDTLEDLIFGL